MQHLSIMRLQTQLYIASTAGLLSHLCFFIKGEHHIQAPELFRVFLLLSFGLIIYEWSLYSPYWRETALAFLYVSFSYGAALFGSILLYRAFFHRLHEYPGPRLAKLSKFWNVARAFRSTNFRLMEEMRCKYGEFVRTGTIPYTDSERHGN